MLIFNPWLNLIRPTRQVRNKSGRRVRVLRPKTIRVSRGMLEGYKFEVRS